MQDLAADESTAGRAGERLAALDEPCGEIEEYDDLAPACGICVAAVLGVVLWAVLAALL